MAEQTFKSPGFFEREIEIINRPTFRNYTTPYGLIGPTEKGPAFVPTTVTSMVEYTRKFGKPDLNRDTGHAAAEFFANGGQALTVCKVLGAGYGASRANAGFEVFGVAGPGGGTNLVAERANGAVQFIVADHTVNNAENFTLGILNDSDSITLAADQDPSDGIDDGTDLKAQLVRAMIFMEKDHAMLITNVDGSDQAADDVAASDGKSRFELKIVTRSNQTNVIASYLVSLDPDDDAYISKVLNTDKFKLSDKKHYLYADFPVDSQVAKVDSDNVAVLRGNADKLNKYGDFKSAFKTPQTSMFISQPFGEREYELFRFESLDDGAYASSKYKISISDLKASTDPNYKYGTFTVQLRDLHDSDLNPTVYESYSRVSLDPQADNFIARVIGDQKIKLSLDVDDTNEQRLVKEGLYENVSERIRVVMSDDVLRGEAPADSLPFGFRGIPMLKTTSNGLDGGNSGTSFLLGVDDGSTSISEGSDAANKLGFSVMPPLPYRMKVTLGDMRKANDSTYFQDYLGQALVSGSLTNKEGVNTNLYWGLNTSRVTNINNPNNAKETDINHLVRNLTKFLSNSDDVLTSGEDSDKINNNKFSLAKVALIGTAASDITGSVSDVFLEAVYVRNADIWSNIFSASSGLITMSSTNDPFTEELAGQDQVTRLSLAGLLQESKTKFNKYNVMAKFTAPFYGGFDGVNIMDRDSYYFTDRSASIEANEGHGIAYASGLVKTNDSSPMSGENLQNNSIAAYRNAIRLMTDELVIDHKVLVVPGIRDSLVTDFAARRVKEFGKAIYLMDIPHYDSNGARIFVDSAGILTAMPDPSNTSVEFDGRELNNNYVAAYFPDVTVVDSGDEAEAAAINNRLVHVPASVVALGALANTDRSQPWFAPAGFSRGSLSSVKAVDVRLSAGDRDELYEARINPIASFPNNQFVIFGQKTTQVAQTALDRVNVRRLMIEIKRKIQKIAQSLLFSQNDAQTRNNFISRASTELSRIQAGSGIEDFRVIMDASNNSEADVENNRLNGKIIVVPTRAVEFIAMDFIITNSGVEFPS